MVIRGEPDGLVAVSQPVHSWVSGQFARHWGNESFPPPTPLAEVCLGAELHDIGFLEWERSPTYNAARQRPHDFTDLPFQPHLDLWVKSVQQVLPFGHYPALLVSRHVCALCRNHVHADTPEESRAIQTFLGEQEQIQNRLLEGLRQDAALASACVPEVLDRNRRLISTWDQHSLLSVLADRGRIVIDDVPGTAGILSLTLHVLGPGRLVIEPWPFSVSELRLRCEARRLPKQMPNELAMHRQLNVALPFSLPLWLSPGGATDHE